jgi:23S rRNA pseudouridine1911/1915/1917 synthase
MTAVPPSEPTTFTLGADEIGRADLVLARRFPGTSRRRLTALFADGAVKIGRRTVKKGDRLAAGDVVTVIAPLDDGSHAPRPDPAAAAQLVILHEDEDVVIVAKPAGMPSQPLRPDELGTVANGLAARFPECATASDDPRDGGLVHRLDIGTSGAIAAARNRATWQALRRGFGAGQVDKRYLALTHGAPAARECLAPLAQRGRKVVVDEADGLDAATAFEVKERLGAWCLVECHATTGRMHQVRAHLALVGAPIAGDDLYGGPPLAGLDGFFLHASWLALPTARGVITVTAPLPPAREAVLAALRAAR